MWFKLWETSLVLAAIIWVFSWWGVLALPPYKSDKAFNVFIGCTSYLMGNGALVLVITALTAIWK